MQNDILQDFVVVEYRDNKRIQIIHVNDITRQGVDAYINVIQTELVDREETTLRTVQKFTKLGTAISPYFLARLKEFSGDNLRKDTHGRVAIVTSMDIFRLMINPVAKIFLRENNKLAIQFFKTVDEAVEWVSDYEV